MVSQYYVAKYLLDQGRQVSLDELSRYLRDGKGNVANALSGLRRHKLVVSHKREGDRHTYYTIAPGITYLELESLRPVPLYEALSGFGSTQFTSGVGPSSKASGPIDRPASQVIGLREYPGVRRGITSETLYKSGATLLLLHDSDLDSPAEAITEQVEYLLNGRETAPFEALAPHRRVRKIVTSPRVSSGFLQPISGGFLMSIRAGVSKKERQAIGAHELAHTFFYDLGPRTPRRMFDGMGDQVEEALCDIAAYRLVSPRMFQKDVDRYASLEEYEKVQFLSSRFLSLCFGPYPKSSGVPAQAF